MAGRGRPPNLAKRQQQQEAFLAAFAETGIAKNAAEAAGIQPPAHYGWLKTDPEYAARFEALVEQTRDLARANRKPHSRGYRVKGARADDRARNQRALLTALAGCGIVMQAAKEAGISVATFYDWCRGDPEFAGKAEAVLRETEGIRQRLVSERVSNASRARWDDPERRAAWSKFQQESWTPEKRAAVSKRTRARMADPEYRRAWLEANRAAAGSPEARAANSARMRMVWENPDFRKRHKTAMADPLVKERLRAAAKKQWEALTPEERKEKLRRMRRVFKGGHRLTLIEAKTMLALNERHLPYFVHMPVGDYVADILVPSLNLIIECDGAWHHDRRAGSDEERDTALKLLGYDTLRLSELEIKGEDWTRLDQWIAEPSK